MDRMIKKDGQYYVEFFAQGGTKKILSPLGKSLKKARETMRATYTLHKDAWLWIKPQEIDMDAIYREARAFRTAATKAFNAGKKIVLVTDAPERFLPLPDGGLNPTAGMMANNGFTYDTCTTREMEQGKLEAYDVAVFPGGFGYFPTKLVAQRIRDFVSRGGGFIGLCAGAFLPLNPCFGIKGVGLGMLNADYQHLRERGVALVRFHPEDPLAYGLKSTCVDVVYALYKIPPKTRKHTVLVSMLRGNGPLVLAKGATRVAGYYDGSQPYAAVVHGRYGKGRIVVFSAHPDAMTFEIARCASPKDAVENLKLAKNAFLYCAGM